MGPFCKGYAVGVWVMTVAMVVMVGGKGVWAQETPACAAKLVPCSAFLNVSKPPESCCSPLREAVQNELPCLCNLYSNPGLFKSLGINISQALELPTHCGINSTIDRCNTKAPPGRAAAPAGLRYMSVWIFVQSKGRIGGAIHGTRYGGGNGLSSTVKRLSGLNMQLRKIVRDTCWPSSGEVTSLQLVSTGKALWAHPGG